MSAIDKYYPNSSFIIEDKSAITKPTAKEEDNPLFLCVASTDKGDEEIVILKNKDSLVERFGEISFSRHGQPLMQAADILDNEGSVVFKRILSPDATLANIVILGKVKAGTEVQKEDAAGKVYLYNGSEVTYTTDDAIPEGATPVMIKTADIKYEAISITNAKTLSDIETNLKTITSPDTDGYEVNPMFIMYDVGRGKSSKKFRISPEYGASTRIDFLRYKLSVIEGTKNLENVIFSIDPNKIYLDTAFNLESVINTNSKQIKCKNLKIEDFVSKIEELTGEANLLSEDIIFGNRRTSEKIQSIVISKDSINFANVFGISLQNGTNGSFGLSPVNTEAYNTEVAKFFAGELTDEIYDPIKYPIEVILDANYDFSIKKKIEDYVIFREDIFYPRDMGLGVVTVEQMRNIMATSAKSKFASTFHTYYDIIDPYTKKQITTTMMQGLAKVLPRHLKYRRNRPVAGVAYNMIMEDAIEGTVNFTPKYTPTIDQKQELDDLRVNYCGYYNNQLVIETQYTSQFAFTQLSYMNNVLAMQDIIRDVRNKCPQTRYSFIEGKDLESYKKAVQAVLDKHSDQFRKLTFEYEEDTIAAQNKIFTGVIVVEYKNYTQSERFKVISI